MQVPASIASTARPGKNEAAATAFAQRSAPSVAWVMYPLRTGAGVRPLISKVGATWLRRCTKGSASMATEPMPIASTTESEAASTMESESPLGRWHERINCSPSNQASFTRVLPMSMIRITEVRFSWLVYLCALSKEEYASLNATKNGALAQLVEQRIENPCVPSSILGGTTRSPEFGASSFSFGALRHM